MQNWIKNIQVKKLISWGIITAICIAATFAVELLYFNYHSLFDYSEELEFAVNDNLIIKNDIANIKFFDVGNENKKIVIKFSEPAYYRKVNIKFDNYKTQRYKLTWTGKDIYDVKKEKTLEDIKKSGYNKGVSNIEDEIYEITIELTGSNRSNITSVKISNSVQINRYRLVLLFTIFFSTVFMLLKRKWFKERMHLIFFVLALVFSISFWFVEDMMQSGWDENVHFTQSYVVACGKEVSYTKAIQELEDLPEEIWANTYEEHRMLIGHFNKAHEKIVEGDITRNISYKDILYFPYIISIKILNMMGCSFFQIYFLSKLSSMICYILIMTYAIKIAKTGKLFLVTTGIMPTRMFINSTYNYDSLTVAFLTLGFVLWINEVLECDKKLTLKKAIMIVLCFLMGSIVKQVYIGFVLLIFLLPNTKFKNSKQKWAIIGGFALTGVIVAMVMVTPMIKNYLGGVSIAGDIRGGNTNVTGQFAVIVEHPIAYATMLFIQIKDSLGEFLLGRFAYVNFSFHRRPEMSFGYITATIMLILFMLRIEDGDDKELVIEKKYKIGIVGVLMLTIILIWSAMYIAYTPVGLESINGVQARYYAPLIYPLMCVLKSKHIVWKGRKDMIHMAMVGIIAFLNMYCIYNICFKPWSI